MWLLLFVLCHPVLFSCEVTLKTKRSTRRHEYRCTSSYVSAPSGAQVLHDRVGKRIAVVTRAMCRVGGAVLAACVLWEVAETRNTPTPTLLQRRRRTVALVQVARRQSARVFRVTPCEFDHVRIQPHFERCRNFAVPPQPLGAESVGKKQNWHAVC